MTRRPLFLFVRPPRPVWPFNGPGTSFWPPVAFASLAASLRDRRPEVEVAILDAPALEMGWASLERELAWRRPDWIGIGEEAVSCFEGLRLARVARAAGAKVVAGGCFFGHVAPQLLPGGEVDVVVHGEGEDTLPELVAAWPEGAAALARVPGISYLHEGAVRRTAPRPLMADLDALPMPAWDLLPMDRYGRRSRNHPAFGALELGRGCLDACDFCVLWRQMGQVDGQRVRPRLRVKSPERLLEEIRVLARRHGRRYLGWVDPCFNADPRVPAALAGLLRQDGLRIGQSAWVRADALVRDQASGALAACVEAGLDEVYVGVERADDEGLDALGKHAAVADARQAFEMLRRHHPSVFTVASFIYGLPGDTPASVRALRRMSDELGADMSFFIPLTPLPGTPSWRPEMWDPTGAAFRRLSFLPDAATKSPLDSLDRALLRALLWHWSPARLRSYWNSLARGGPRKRRMALRLFARDAGFVLRRLAGSSRARDAGGGLILPAWYHD